MYQTENEVKRREHKLTQHQPKVVPVVNQYLYPCDECELKTMNIDELVIHKKTVHGVLRYACDMCEHVDSLLEGLWRHKINSHQAYEPNGPEATYSMQQMLLISLSAQVEFIVQSMAKLGVALAKTSRFDTKIQNDSQAVLTQVSAKCIEIGNIVLNGGI